MTAGLCFTLFFWSRFLGGTAGWLEVILVLAGAAFLALELFVLPGFGIAGILGLLLMTAGIVMASQNHLIPQSPRAGRPGEIADRPADGRRRVRAGCRRADPSLRLGPHSQSPGAAPADRDRATRC